MMDRSAFREGENLVRSPSNEIGAVVGMHCKWFRVETDEAPED